MNQQAEVEMDALIATDDYKLGSVCALQNVLHPIAVARLVRDKTKHVMLVGNGAFQFAMEEGIKVPISYVLLIYTRRSVNQKTF